MDMPTTVRQIRVKLPRPLFEKLSVQADLEKTDVPTLILRAVRGDLQADRPSLPPRLRGGAGRTKKRP